MCTKKHVLENFFFTKGVNMGVAQITWAKKAPSGVETECLCGKDKFWPLLVTRTVFRE